MKTHTILPIDFAPFVNEVDAMIPYEPAPEDFKAILLSGTLKTRTSDRVFPSLSQVLSGTGIEPVAVFRRFIPAISAMPMRMSNYDYIMIPWKHTSDCVVDILEENSVPPYYRPWIEDAVIDWYPINKHTVTETLSASDDAIFVRAGTIHNFHKTFPAKETTAGEYLQLFVNAGQCESYFS